MPTANCTRDCWLAAAALGLIVWILTGAGALAWYEGLVLGLIATGLSGAFLVWFACGGAPAASAAAWQPAPPDSGRADSRAAPSQPVSRDVAAPKPTAKEPAPAPAPRAAARPEPAKPVAARPEAAKPAPAAAAKPTAGASAEANDLKEIKGVGPKLEQLLHENGITRFDQIAAWDDAEMDRFAELIGRMGSRIRSDDWVGQAKTLAAGGETEFSRRVGEGDVY